METFETSVDGTFVRIQDGLLFAYVKDKIVISYRLVQPPNMETYPIPFLTEPLILIYNRDITEPDRPITQNKKGIT